MVSFDLHCFERRELSDKGLRVLGGFGSCIHTLDDNGTILVVVHVFDDDVKAIWIKSLIPDGSDWGWTKFMLSPCLLLKMFIVYPIQARLSRKT